MRFPLVVVALTLLCGNSPLHSEPQLAQSERAQKISQRIEALRNRLESFRQGGAKPASQAEAVSLIENVPMPKDDEFIMKSTALEHRRDVKVVVLYHEGTAAAEVEAAETSETATEEEEEEEALANSPALTCLATEQKSSDQGVPNTPLVMARAVRAAATSPAAPANPSPAGAASVAQSKATSMAMSSAAQAELAPTVMASAAQLKPTATVGTSVPQPQATPLIVASVSPSTSEPSAPPAAPSSGTPEPAILATPSVPENFHRESPRERLQSLLRLYSLGRSTNNAVQMASANP